MKVKKILFLIPTLAGGGAEKVLIDIVNNLDYNKFDITVQTLISKGIYIKKLNEHIKYRTIIKTNNQLVQRLIAYAIQFIIPPRLTYILFIKKDYDVEIAFLEGSTVKILSGSNDKRIKKYTWVHIDLEKYYRHQKLFKSIEENRKYYLNYDKIFCVSNEVKDSFIRTFQIEENVYVLYNILDKDDIESKANEVCDYQFSDRLTLVSVGRLCHQKGFDRLINICNKLLQEGHNYELIIIGEGEERFTLENQISQLHLENYVKLLGYKENPYKYIKRCDIFICSSRAEGFSLAIAEALILGLPIVSTDCSGPNELLGYGKYGILTSNSEDCLLDGIRTMIVHPNQRLSYRYLAKLRAAIFDKQEKIIEIEKILEG